MSDGGQVAFEVLKGQPTRNQLEIASYLYVDCVKPNKRCIKSDIQFSQHEAQDIRTAVFGDKMLQLIQSNEDRNQILLIRRLIWSKASLVDTRVEVGLHPFGDGVNLSTHAMRVVGDFGKGWWKQRIEGVW